MAGNVQKRDIKRNIRERKLSFLANKGSAGGEKFEFITDVISDVDDVMKGVEKDAALKEVLAAYAAAVWDSKTKRIDDQLIIAGFELDQEIRYRDENSASGYRTVLARYATIRQHAASIELLIADRDDIDKKINEQKALNDHARSLAGGNLDALISRFCDVREAAE